MSRRSPRREVHAAVYDDDDDDDGSGILSHDSSHFSAYYRSLAAAMAASSLNSSPSHHFAPPEGRPVHETLPTLPRRDDTPHHKSDHSGLSSGIGDCSSIVEDTTQSVVRQLFMDEEIPSSQGIPTQPAGAPSRSSPVHQRRMPDITPPVSDEGGTSGVPPYARSLSGGDDAPSTMATSRKQQQQHHLPPEDDTTAVQHVMDALFLQLSRIQLMYRSIFHQDPPLPQPVTSSAWAGCIEQSGASSQQREPLLSLLGPLAEKEVELSTAVIRCVQETNIRVLRDINHGHYSRAWEALTRVRPYTETNAGQRMCDAAVFPLGGTITVPYFCDDEGKLEQMRSRAIVANNQGLYHFKLKEYERSRERLLEAVAVEERLMAPSIGVTYFNLAQAEHQLSRKRGPTAKRAADRCIEYIGAAEDAMEQRVYTLKCELHRQQRGTPSCPSRLADIAASSADNGLTEEQKGMVTVWLQWREAVCMLSLLKQHHANWLGEQGQYQRALPQYEQSMRWLTSISRLSAEEQQRLAVLRRSMAECKRAARTAAKQPRWSRPASALRRGHSTEKTIATTVLPKHVEIMDASLQFTYDKPAGRSSKPPRRRTASAAGRRKRSASPTSRKKPSQHHDSKKKNRHIDEDDEEEYKGTKRPKSEKHRSHSSRDSTKHRHHSHHHEGEDEKAAPPSRKASARPASRRPSRRHASGSATSSRRRYSKGETEPAVTSHEAVEASASSISSFGVPHSSHRMDWTEEEKALARETWQLWWNWCQLESHHVHDEDQGEDDEEIGDDASIPEATMTSVQRPPNVGGRRVTVEVREEMTPCELLMDALPTQGRRAADTEVSHLDEPSTQLPDDELSDLSTFSSQQKVVAGPLRRAGTAAPIEADSVTDVVDILHSSQDVPQEAPDVCILPTRPPEAILSDMSADSSDEEAVAAPSSTTDAGEVVEEETAMTAVVVDDTEEAGAAVEGTPAADGVPQPHPPEAILSDMSTDSSDEKAVAAPSSATDAGEVVEEEKSAMNHSDEANVTEALQVPTGDEAEMAIHPRTSSARYVGDSTPSDSAHPTPRGSETPEKPTGDTIEDVKRLCDELERRLERLVRHSSTAAREVAAHRTPSSVASTARPSVVSPHISSSSSNHTSEDHINKVETAELHAAAAAPPPSALEATPIGRPPSAARTFFFVRDPTSLRSLSKAQKRIFRFASGSEEGRAASRGNRFYFEPTADTTLPYHDMQ